MTIPRWRPRRHYTREEKYLLKRLKRNRKLFAFLCEYRREIFDDAFQAELEGMYRGTGAGKTPRPPAMMAMIIILQGYMGTSDSETVEATWVDLRWRMVLDRMTGSEPACSQGALHDFRHRLIRTNMDKRLLERTVDFARESGAFDPKTLAKAVRVAVDSSPLEGAARVEDSVNLIANAARQVVTCAANLLSRSPDDVARDAGIPVLLASSVKKALDVDWTDRVQKFEAVQTLLEQVVRLDIWIEKTLPAEMETSPLREHLETLHEVANQDIEFDPTDPSGRSVRIRDGVAKDRRISIRDPEMRHGRKTKTKAFNGFKRHVVADLDTPLIFACAVTPANRPDAEALPELTLDLAKQGRTIDELHIDRGFISSPVVDFVLKRGADVVCRPWIPRNGTLFTKRDFVFNMRNRTVTCPAGQTESFRFDSTVKFNPAVCDICELRSKCTSAALGRGRSLRIAHDEQLQHRLRKRIETPAGRGQLRERIAVEHRLAHIGQRQGRKARYVGTRANLYDVRRAATIQNLEAVHRNVPMPVYAKAA